MIKRLTTLAFSRGLLGGSKPWLAIGGAVGLFRFFQWAARGTEKTVFSEELQPGETLVIAREAPKKRR